MRRNIIYSLFFICIILLINYLLKKEPIQEIFTTKKINKIILVNNKYISDEFFFTKLNIYEGQSFWSFNPFSLKSTLDSIKEIESYNFKLSWDGTLKIKIKEKKPYMLWIFNNQKNYIDKNGQILEFKVDHSELQIIKLVGGNANTKIKELTNILKNYENIFLKINQINFDKKLGWQIKLFNRKCIFLPFKKLDRLINIFEDILNSKLYEKFSFFDFRVLGRIYMSNEEC